MERYIHIIFRKQSIDYNSAKDTVEAAKYFHIENECACFHTGLYTERYKASYAFFDRNKRRDCMLDWYFRGFCDKVSPRLKYLEPLPERPHYHVARRSDCFNPDWSIRVKVEHILGDEKIWDASLRIRKAKNLSLLLETAVELARRKAVVEPGIVVPQGYQVRIQYLLPVYITNMKKPDLAMTLSVMG